MLARVHSCAVIGLEGEIIEVEVDTGQGLPGMTIVGLPDAAVQESRERVQAAIKNAGLPYPRARIVVNLAPAIGLIVMVVGAVLAIRKDITKE